MKPIQKIPLQEIDLSDETFSVNFMPDLQDLRSSIKAIGLIQPVLLRKKGDQYQIVCGFRRISVLKELGSREVESRILGESERDELELFSISLHENLTSRGFNSVEKAITFYKLVHHFQIEPSAVIQRYLPLFSLEPNEKILGTYLSLAEMEDEVKKYVLKEGVSRSNIRRLATLSSDDRRSLLSLIVPLKLGENRLREMITLLDEITRREQVIIKEIIDRPEIQAFLSQKELTPIQRTERVKRVLMGLRYPKMRRMEEEFEKKRKELNLPSGVSLHHPPYFEGNGLRIEFQFESVDEYRAILSSLSLLADKEEFREMIQATG
ncbi:MAG: ParB/RepB/Spo0J family partition protein [Thermodesulfobacteriota bacterium]|nr:ParB/RepB/Spo0J family partition protein [Thermodesulfobacteriota bacterium]